MVKLSDVCIKITDGSQYSPESVDKGYPMFSVKDMRENGFSYSDCKYISEEEFANMKSNGCVPQTNDVLIAKDGSYLKHVFVVTENRDEAILSSIGILRPDIKKVNPYYIKYFLSSDFVKEQVARKYVSGSALPRIILKNFANIEIPLIDMEFQNRIVEVLKSIDDKIENNNVINAELESMARTIYDYWFLQFDFPDENGNPYKSSGGKMVWNEELKREIPEGWEAIKLGDIFDFVKGKIPNELFDFQTEELDNYLTIDAVNTGTTQYCNSDSMVLTDGEVLMVMDGAASSEVYVGNKGVIGSTFCKLKIKRDYISNNLLYLIMKKYEDIFKKVNTGSTVPHANKNYINDFYICMPKDIHKRKELQKVFEDLINKNSHMKKENQELVSLRDFLLPLLMNGQVGFKN